jgi:hypothetical protein
MSFSNLINFSTVKIIIFLLQILNGEFKQWLPILSSMEGGK